MEQGARVLPERTDFLRDRKQRMGGGGGTGEVCLLGLRQVKVIPGFLMTWRICSQLSECGSLLFC